MKAAIVKFSGICCVMLLVLTLIMWVDGIGNYTSLSASNKDKVFLIYSGSGSVLVAFKQSGHYDFADGFDVARVHTDSLLARWVMYLGIDFTPGEFSYTHEYIITDVGVGYDRLLAFAIPHWFIATMTGVPTIAWIVCCLRRRRKAHRFETKSSA